MPINPRARRIFLWALQGAIIGFTFAYFFLTGGLYGGATAWTAGALAGAFCGGLIAAMLPSK